MKEATLAQLKRLNAKSYWEGEGRSFIAWLAEDRNIRLLGEAIGIELEVQAREKALGPFRPDLLCRDVAANSWVLVESQMEPTDHRHLGQMLTYAAGLSADTIVWIADRFTQEHRAAIDWLNKISNERISIYGLEIELWRIGESPPAPKFNVVCAPNSWSQSVTGATSRIQATELSETKRLQLEYWRAFRDYLIKEASPLRPAKVMPLNWLGIGVGRSGFGLNAVASTYNPETDAYDSGEIRVEVVITHADAKVYFALLEDQREEIEHALGGSLTWYDPPDAKYNKIILRRPADVTNRREWPEQHVWLKSRLEAFHQVFGPRIRALSLDDNPEGTAEGRSQRIGA